MDRVLFKIGNFTIYWYSLMILLGIILGSIVVLNRAKKLGIKKEVEDLIFYLVLFGILGARIYYVIFNFKLYKNNLLEIFMIWEGGIAIYGGIIAGIVVLYYYAKRHKMQVVKLMDVFAPGLILAQAIGRWGNFFNQEAHGGITSLVFLKRLHLPKFIIDGMLINGHYYHPTFLYESIGCILGFIILIIVRKYYKKDGTIAYIYFIWYGIIRFMIEGIRTDSLYIGSFRISQIVSIILVVIGLVGLCYNIYKRNKERGIKNETKRNT